MIRRRQFSTREEARRQVLRGRRHGGCAWRRSEVAQGHLGTGVQRVQGAEV